MYYWELSKGPGVYTIESAATGYCYIGSARSMRTRGCSHKTDLVNNKHTNRLLQLEWNRYGEKNFTIRPLESCVESVRREREQVWIDDYLTRGVLLYNRTLRVALVPDRPQKPASRRSRSGWRAYKRYFQ